MDVDTTACITLTSAPPSVAGLFFRHDRQAVNAALYGFPLGRDAVSETLDGLNEVGN